MSRPNSKTIILAKTLFLGLVFIFILIRPQKTKSAQDCNALELMGYAWSENIGWLSFNCADTATCAAVDYKVTIDGATGKFSGYAWSENIGWLNFGPDGPYPGAPGHEADLNTANGLVTGWARACSVFAAGCDGALKSPTELGGWDGWLKMSDGSYEVTYDDSANEFRGWAWGSDVLGWVSFNNCLAPGSCSATNYKVSTTFGLVPNSPTNLQVNTKAGYFTEPYNVQDPCVASTDCTETPTPKFAWTPDGVQEEYQIQLDNNSDFSSTIWDSGWVVSDASTNITYAGSALAWDTEYFWRVKTKSCFNESNWSDPARFTTNRYPLADFSTSYGFQGEDTVYTFTSTSLDPDHEEPSGYAEIPAANGGLIAFEWDLDDDDSYDDGTGASASLIITGPGSRIIKLKVTDDGGLKNIISEVVNLEFLPQLVAESGDVYSLKNIKGKNINFDAAYLIHAGGQISNVAPSNLANYGNLTFPSEDAAYISDLGKIDWTGLVSCSGSPCLNKYKYVVETITNENQINNPLSGKVYYYNGDLRINASDLTFNNNSLGKGNGLILVNGDLTVEKNITYSENPKVTDPKKLAALGWVVKGDLIIAPAVENLVGAFVILGADGVGDCTLTQISEEPLQYRLAEHCGLVKTGSRVPDSDDIPLTIKGLLFARRLFFQRAVRTLAPGDYAEKIIYDNHIFLNPPPGMDDFIKGLPAWQKVAP